MSGMSLSQLQEQVRGEVVVPGDEGYDEAQVVKMLESIRDPSGADSPDAAGPVKDGSAEAPQTGRPPVDAEKRMEQSDEK